MSPRIALFYDWLNQWGGAEQLLLDIANIWPEAPVYTLYHQIQKTPWTKNLKIRPSFLNRLPLSTLHPSPYTPWHNLALEQFNFNSFDILITLTSQSGHAIITQPQTLHLNYCLTPNRYLWLHPPASLTPFLTPFKKIDYLLAQRPDYFLTTSQTVQKRIHDCFQRDSILIHPGIDTDFFVSPLKKSLSNPYFLLVSRLVDHKKTDLAIRTFNHTPDKLIIVGQGRQEKYLKSIARPNIQFLGSVSRTNLLQLYQNATALVCPQEEDFGLTPLEAMACGTPVIAYQKGGHSETVSLKTGLFFSRPTLLSLRKTIVQFKKQNFLSSDCRRQSLKFSQRNFMINFKATVDKLWQSHLKKLSFSPPKITT